MSVVLSSAQITQTSDKPWAGFLRLVSAQKSLRIRYGLNTLSSAQN